MLQRSTSKLVLTQSLLFLNQSSTFWRYIPPFINFLTLSTNVSLFKAATTAALAAVAALEAAVTAVAYQSGTLGQSKVYCLSNCQSEF